jgi:hypothetical protein
MTMPAERRTSIAKPKSWTKRREQEVPNSLPSQHGLV